MSDVKYVFKELRAYVKEQKEVLGEAQFKDAFGNYTQLSTEELGKIVDKYKKKAIKSTPAPVKTVPVKTTSAPAKALNVIPELEQVVTSVAVSKVVKPNTVTINIPIEFIPVGTYVEQLTEAEGKAAFEYLKNKYNWKTRF